MNAMLLTLTESKNPPGLTAVPLGNAKMTY